MRTKKVYFEETPDPTAIDFLGFKFDSEVGKYYTEEPDLTEEEYKDWQNACWDDYCNQFNGVGCI